MEGGGADEGHSSSSSSSVPKEVAEVGENSCEKVEVKEPNRCLSAACDDCDEEDKKVPAAAALAAMSGKAEVCTQHISNGNKSSATRTTGRRKALGRGVSSNERWEEMFKRLKKFKQERNHCNVPNRYPEDPSLGCWVSTQRRHYKRAQIKPGEGITPDRAGRLMQLGFEWTGENPRHKNWDIRFEELKHFKAKYGHAQVPIGFEDNVQLANWTSTQRQEYKNLLKGKASRLNKQRIKLLESIGFVWELQRGGRRRRVTVTQGATSTGTMNPSSSDAEGKAVVKMEGARIATAKASRSTSLVLPGVALLGGDQDHHRMSGLPSSMAGSSKRPSPQFGRARQDRDTSNSVDHPQPFGSSSTEPLTQQHASSAAIVMGNRGNLIHTHGTDGSSRHQATPTADLTHPSRAFNGNTANALQALAMTQLLTASPRNLNASLAYQQALAFLASLQDGTVLSLGALPASALAATSLGLPSTTDFHLMLSHQSCQSERLRLELQVLARQPNMASEIANSLFLQAASVLLHPPPQPTGAATRPVGLQSNRSRRGSSLAARRVEAKPNNIHTIGQSTPPESLQQRQRPNGGEERPASPHVDRGAA